MKRTAVWLGLAILFGVGTSASAQISVFETAKGSATVTSVLISSESTTAQQIDVSTRVVTERFVFELWNDDTSNNLYCGFDVNVSTIVSPALSLNYGRRIQPQTAWTVAVPNSVKVYCRTSGAPDAAGTNNTSRVVFTQLW